MGGRAQRAQGIKRECQKGCTEGNGVTSGTIKGRKGE